MDDNHYKDLIEADANPPQSNAVLADLTRANSTLKHDMTAAHDANDLLMQRCRTLTRDLKLITADRNNLIDQIAKRWPDNKRIDAIGQNGGTGEHYVDLSASEQNRNRYFGLDPAELKGDKTAELLVLKPGEPVRYMVGAAIFQTKEGAINCHKVCLSSGVECAIIPLYAGEPLEVKK